MNQQTLDSGKIYTSDGALDPINRTTEILFGLIMVLTFTCSLSAVEAGHSEVREMLYGALGCNVAWGIIDAFFYLLNNVAQRGRERLLIRKLKNTQDQESAQELFQSVIPESILGSLNLTSFGQIRDRLIQAPRSALVTCTDLKAAFVVFALVFLTTFPVAVPFLIMHDPWPAVRVSNLIALLLLFGLGYNLGRYAGMQAWLWGFGMMVIGVVLVAITIALGG